MSIKKTDIGCTPGFKYKRPKEPKVQLKVDVPAETKARLSKVADETGFSMGQIVTMLVKYYVNSMDVEHDMRKLLAEATTKWQQDLKLSPRQKKLLRENIVHDKFTKDLL